MSPTPRRAFIRASRSDPLDHVAVYAAVGWPPTAVTLTTVQLYVSTMVYSCMASSLLQLYQYTSDCYSCMSCLFTLAADPSGVRTYSNLREACPSTQLHWSPVSPRDVRLSLDAGVGTAAPVRWAASRLLE